VLSTFPMRIAPSSMTTMSVNVPPTSTPALAPDGPLASSDNVPHDLLATDSLAQRLCDRFHTLKPSLGFTANAGSLVVTPGKQGTRRVPQTTVRRMSTYLRVLGTEDMAEAPYTSSERLSRLTGFSAPQVRRDLGVVEALVSEVLDSKDFTIEWEDEDEET